MIAKSFSSQPALRVRTMVLLLTLSVHAREGYTIVVIRSVIHVFDLQSTEKCNFMY